MELHGGLPAWFALPASLGKLSFLNSCVSGEAVHYGALPVPAQQWGYDLSWDL